MNPFSPRISLPGRGWLLGGALAALAGSWGLLAHRLVRLLGAEQLDRGLANGLLGGLFAFASAVALASLVGGALLVLRRSQRALTATIESMADAVLVLDRRGKVLEANRAALGLFAVTEACELLVPLGQLCARWELPPRRPDSRPRSGPSSAPSGARASTARRRCCGCPTAACGS